MDPSLVWALVVLTVVAGAYDIARRAIAAHRAQELEPLVQGIGLLRDHVELVRQDVAMLKGFDIESLRADHAEHVKTFEALMLQWRDKVGELEKRIATVTVDAKNELAGTLASVDAMQAGKKGWR